MQLWATASGSTQIRTCREDAFKCYQNRRGAIIDDSVMRLTLLKEVFGFEHKKVADCLAVVGKLYSATNRVLYAEGVFNKSLDILSKNKARYVPTLLKRRGT